MPPLHFVDICFVTNASTNLSGPWENARCVDESWDCGSIIGCIYNSIFNRRRLAIHRLLEGSFKQFIPGLAVMKAFLLIFLFFIAFTRASILNPKQSTRSAVVEQGEPLPEEKIYEDLSAHLPTAYHNEADWIASFLDLMRGDGPSLTSYQALIFFIGALILPRLLEALQDY